jgi:hypothetical protein
MSRTAWVLLDDSGKEQLTAIAGNCSRPLKHILPERTILLHARSRPSVQWRIGHGPANCREWLPARHGYGRLPEPLAAPCRSAFP